MILPFSYIILWNNAALVRDSFQIHEKKILQSQPLQFLSHNTYFTILLQHFFILMAACSLLRQEFWV